MCLCVWLKFYELLLDWCEFLPVSWRRWTHGGSDIHRVVSLATLMGEMFSLLVSLSADKDCMAFTRLPATVMTQVMDEALVCRVCVFMFAV